MLRVLVVEPAAFVFVVVIQFALASSFTTEN